jgi:hypothetical protein
MRSTRTRSPYFSPNSAIAPNPALGHAHLVDLGLGVARICALTIASMRASLSALIGWKCEKSKRRRSGATSEPFCVTCLAEHGAQRRMQQVRGGMVEHGRLATRASTAPTRGRRPAARPRSVGRVAVEDRRDA